MYIKEPIAVVILEDNIIGCINFDNRDFTQIGSRKLCTDFYRIALERYEFPKKIALNAKKILNEYKMEDKKKEFQLLWWESSLVGICNDTDGCTLGVSAELEKTNNLEKLRLKNIKIELEDIPINCSELSLFDTFLFTSNLLVTNFLSLNSIRQLDAIENNKFYSFNYEKWIDHLDKEEVFDTQPLENRNIKTYLTYDEKTTIFRKIAVEFLQFAKKEIIGKELDVKDLLRLGCFGTLLLLRELPEVQDLILKAYKIASSKEANCEYSLAERTTYLSLACIYTFERFNGTLKEIQNQIELPNISSYREVKRILKRELRELKFPFPGRGERFSK